MKIKVKSIIDNLDRKMIIIVVGDIEATSILLDYDATSHIFTD